MQYRLQEGYIDTSILSHEQLMFCKDKENFKQARENSHIIQMIKDKFPDAKLQEFIVMVQIVISEHFTGYYTGYRKPAQFELHNLNNIILFIDSLDEICRNTTITKRTENIEFIVHDKDPHFSVRIPYFEITFVYKQSLSNYYHNVYILDNTNDDRILSRFEFTQSFS